MIFRNDMQMDLFLSSTSGFLDSSITLIHRLLGGSHSLSGDRFCGSIELSWDSVEAGARQLASIYCQGAER